MNRWIAFLFMAVLSLQALPVKELGKLLSKGQVCDEEIQNSAKSCDESQESKVKKEVDPSQYYYQDQAQARAVNFDVKIKTAIYKAKNLIKDFTPDVLTPPPNCI